MDTDKIGQYIKKGDPAGMFADHVEVWTEVGVRVSVGEAIWETEKRESIKAKIAFVFGIVIGIVITVSIVLQAGV